MPDIQPAPGHDGSPARIITDAVNAAIDRGLTVSTNPDLGVISTSTHAPAWVPDPGARAVSPLGAVLLDKQPGSSEPVAALVIALDVGTTWTEGFDDGCDARPLRKNLETGLGGGLYIDGYRVGSQVRVLLNRVQARARTLVEVAPKTLIRQLLGSLTLAQGLDALAETVPARALSAEDEEDVLGMLRTHAELFRALKV